MTLKQSQGHQAYDNVDPKQGYNHAEFEGFCFDGVREKVNIKVFSNEEICLEPVRKYKNSRIFMIFLI